MASFQALDGIGSFQIIPSFETPWTVPLAKLIFADTADSVLKSLWGAQGWNTEIIEKLKKASIEPLPTGTTREAYMIKKSSSMFEKVTPAIVNSFLRHYNAPEIRDVPLGEAATQAGIGKLTLPLVLILGIVGVIQLGPMISTLFSKKR